MAQIYPLDFLPSSSSSSSSSYITSEREVFTIWMKSLVMNSNGCTVFDSKGQVVYRIDNYDYKCRNEVYLMDLKGKVVSTIQRKKTQIFRRWEGYKSDVGSKGKPWFQVRKNFRWFKSLKWELMDEHKHYKMERLKGSSSKLECKIVDENGSVVAELKQKKSSRGIVLGDDVLNLVVEPNVDHSLIMGFIVVNSLVNHRM